MTLEQRKTFVMARSNGRPTLQHRLDFHRDGSVTTLCGRDTSRWSKAYFAGAIDELVCRNCKRLGA